MSSETTENLDDDDAGPHGATDGADEAVASAESAFVPRDETGEVAEVRTTAVGQGACTVRPMVYGQAERYFGDAGGVATAGPRVVAEIMDTHVTEPDFSAHVREDDYLRKLAEKDRREGDYGPDEWVTETVVAEGMTPFAPQSYLMAVLRESGMDADVSVNADGEATIEFDDETDEGN